MIKINLNGITWDYTKIKKITELATSEESASYLKSSATSIINKSNPQLPVNYGKRNTNATPLNQAIIKTEPKIKRKKVKGISYSGYSITIKPKKRQVYYYVVMSGNNTYNNKKVKLKYQNPAAIPYAIEKNANEMIKNEITPWFRNQIIKKVRETN